MKYIQVNNYSDKRITKFLETFKDINYNFIFNISTFEKKGIVKQYFKPDFIIELLGKLYKDRPIVVEVSEFVGNSNIDIYGIKYVITGFSSNIYPNIQVIYFIQYGEEEADYYTIRYMDTTVASHVIYRENVSKSLHVVLKDFETLGFKKAVKLMSLCETCKFYDDESYYMKCAVHPSKSHDTVFDCRDYEQVEILVF
jgi:hypothetical protein